MSSDSAGALPPLNAWSRRSDGGRIGPCPKCGGQKWWDNRGAKRAAQANPKSPDFSCVDCGHGRWEGEVDWPAWEPEPTTVLPTVSLADAGRCVALRADGQPCRNTAMSGSDRCGPHAQSPVRDQTGSRNQARGPAGGPVSNQCHGTTKAGKPCRAGAQRGQLYCPAHDPGRM
jgi:hypothetical protein